MNINSRMAAWLLTAAVGVPGVTGAQQMCKAAGKLMSVAELPEASGVAASRKHDGVLWSHNDSGEPVIVAVGADGSVMGSVKITGAGVSDWEDIEVGPCPAGSCVYIADIGDNDASRSSITIWRVREPDPGAGNSAAAESMRLTYPDGARDAESLIVLPNGSMLVVSKGEKSTVAVYRAPSFRNGASVRMESVATLSTNQKGVGKERRITGGSASPDGRWIVLRTVSSLAFYDANELGKGNVREAFQVDVSGVGEAQGEGVAVGDNGTIWLASEGGGKDRPGTLVKFNCTMR